MWLDGNNTNIKLASRYYVVRKFAANLYVEKSVSYSLSLTTLHFVFLKITTFKGNPELSNFDSVLSQVCFSVNFNKMTINTSAWRLAAQISIYTLVITTILSNNKPVAADLSIVPLWNVTANQTDSNSCDLAIHSNLQDIVKLTVYTVETCSVQLTASNETAVLIRIPQGALVYAERQKKILNCQKKYVSFRADKSCLFVSRHPKLQLSLQGDDANGSSISISPTPENTTAPICQDGTGSEGHHTSRVSQTNHCQAQEFDFLISCILSPDYKCSFKFSQQL